MGTENRLPPPISIHSKERLRELQSMNLSEKIDTSISRLIEWYQYWGGRVTSAFRAVRIPRFVLIWRLKFAKY